MYKLRAVVFVQLDDLGQSQDNTHFHVLLLYKVYFLFLQA